MWPVAVVGYVPHTYVADCASPHSYENVAVGDKGNGTTGAQPFPANTNDGQDGQEEFDASINALGARRHGYENVAVGSKGKGINGAPLEQRIQRLSLAITSSSDLGKTMVNTEDTTTGVIEWKKARTSSQKRQQSQGSAEKRKSWASMGQQSEAEIEREKAVAAKLEANKAKYELQRTQEIEEAARHAAAVSQQTPAQAEAAQHRGYGLYHDGEGKSRPEEPKPTQKLTGRAYWESKFADRQKMFK